MAPTKQGTASWRELAGEPLILVEPGAAVADYYSDCLVWAQPDSSKRPGGGSHKLKIRMPDAMARDEASLKRVFPLDALAARLTGLYQNPVEHPL